MTNIDGERKEFEAWYAGEYLNASSPIFRDAKFAKNGNDTYHSAEIRKSWNGWLARAQVGRAVDEAMVWRACEAYEHSDRTVSGTQHIEASELGMKAALIAALEVGK